MDTFASPPVSVSRRGFIRQSFAFSALAMLGPVLDLPGVLPSDRKAADLLVIGDWGFDYEGHTGEWGYDAEGRTAQSRVAAGMQQYVRRQAIRPQALLMLGDNWYGELAGGARSPRWRRQFEAMYPVDVFPGPAYAILGNHDYQRWPESKVDAELEYSRIGKTRWIMPARWYRFEFPKRHPLITFIALDSNMPYNDGRWDFGRDFMLTPQQQADQLAWLQIELQRPRNTPFLVVMGHHPVYSDGPHGDHPVLIRDWDPLFQKYGVHLYLAGHDHDLQHLEFEGHPTSHFLSGGGGADLYNLKIDSSQRGPYAQKILGFSHLSVTRKEMVLRHLDSEGRILHGFTKSPDGEISFLTE